MFFTQEDYRKIYDWLSRNTIKDSEFDTALEPFSGLELVTILLNGKSVTISLRALVAQFSLLGALDFINVTAEFNARNISIEHAILLIPYKDRKIGLVITFLDIENKWKLYQFQGQNTLQWNSVSAWKDLVKEIQGVSITADEEDLTEEEISEGQKVIKFKNKIYAEDGISGLGRIYLRKNIINGDNILSQDMLPYANTVYIIQYDYDLNGLTITVPEGCILLFEGGSLKNGTIILQETKILPYGAIITDYISATINGTYAKGQQLYDNESNRPIWWTGTKWVDATGAEV